MNYYYYNYHYYFFVYGLNFHTEVQARHAWVQIKYDVCFGMEKVFKNKKKSKALPVSPHGSL
jgi:hypothetical protein